MPFALFSMLICTYKVSGGHLNPALTFGVYLERKEYCPGSGFLISYWVAQFLGSLTALIFGVLIRVQMPRTAVATGGYYYVPDQNAFFPPIIEQT